MIERMGRFVPADQKISVIHITGYQDRNFEGTLQNPFYPEKQGFKNLTQLLLLIEQLQDSIQFPQKGMERRSFTDEAPAVNPTEVPQGAPLATFKLNLLFRQNASWQGSVVWVEKGMDAQFRSALELVCLMDSVLAA